MPNYQSVGSFEVGFVLKVKKNNDTFSCFYIVWVFFSTMKRKLKKASIVHFYFKSLGVTKFSTGELYSWSDLLGTVSVLKLGSCLLPILNFPNSIISKISFCVKDKESFVFKTKQR